MRIQEKADVTKVGTEGTPVPASLKLSIETFSDIKDKPIIGDAGTRRWQETFSKMQHDSWKVRQEDTRNIAGHVRIAFSRWKLTPATGTLLPNCAVSLGRTTGPDPKEKNCLGECKRICRTGTRTAADGISIRRVVARSIDAVGFWKKYCATCGNFKVDILVLPEYSVRPETVQWIAKMLPELASKTSIWAGTFRKPPYITGDCASIFSRFRIGLLHSQLYFRAILKRLPGLYTRKD